MGNKHRYTCDWFFFFCWGGVKTCLVGWWIDKHHIKIYVKWKNSSRGYVCKILNDRNFKGPTGSACHFEWWEHSYFTSWNLRKMLWWYFVCCRLKIKNLDWNQWIALGTVWCFNIEFVHIEVSSFSLKFYPLLSFLCLFRGAEVGVVCTLFPWIIFNRIAEVFLSVLVSWVWKLCAFNYKDALAVCGKL
jgi:hypothetical protein